MPTLHFKGKTFVQNHHLAVKYHQLIPQRELSLTDNVSLHDNLIIQGDNLKALKALLPTYAGKVKCIYIDPPYNTGNENWVYNDNVNSPMLQEWLNKVVDKEDMTRHDKWLCMMMPRLKLLKELLSEDGAIFISIDDNEQHNLRLLLDEVFGADNFIACLPTVMNLKGNNDQIGFAGTHEYTLVYANNSEFSSIGEFNLDEEENEDWSEDEYGYYKKGANLKSTGGNAPKQKRPNLFFPIFVDEFNNVYVTDNDLPPIELKDKKYSTIFPITNTEEMSWRWSKNKINNEKHNIILSHNGELSIYKKQRPSLGDLPSKKPKSIFYKPEYSSGNGTSILKEIFGNKEFANPKPLNLIKDILFLSTNKDSIILDSFAGSGTTAHAVLDLNKEDGGNRKFILIEQEDYANNITAERVRRVIKGVPTAKNENLKNGLGGTFSYFKLGDTIEMESLLKGENLPSYLEFARYLFYTATGEEFNEKKLNEKTWFIGESTNYEVYLIYKPDIDWLKQNALTLDICQSLPNFKGKQRLVFAPCKYVDDYTCLDFRIDFCQLPYEIYRLNR